MILIIIYIFPSRGGVEDLMAFEFVVKADLGIVFVRHFDNIEINELAKLFQEVLKSPVYSPGMDFCRDTRGAIFPDKWSFNYFNSPMSVEVYRLLLSIGNCKLAWIVDKGRQYQVAHQINLRNRLNQTSLITRKNFTDPKSAYNWLALPENFEFSFTDTT